MKQWIIWNYYLEKKIDLLIIDTWNAGDLNKKEEIELMNFIQKGGTCLLHCFSERWNGVELSSASLELFKLRGNSEVNNGYIRIDLSESLRQSHGIFREPFGKVLHFSNRVITEFSPLKSTFEDNGMIALPGISSHDPSKYSPLAILPRGKEGLGQVLFLTNYHTIGNKKAWEGGLFEENSVLLLNLAAHSLWKIKNIY